MLKKVFTLLILFFFSFSFQSQAQFAVFNPAEFEESEGLLFAWGQQPEIDSVILEVARIAQQSALIWMIYDSETQGESQQLLEYFYQQGLMPEKLNLLDIKADSPWIRDYAPHFMFGNFGEGNERYMVDADFSHHAQPFSDSLSYYLSEKWAWERQDLDLSLESGNLAFDGLIRGFTTRRVLQQNEGHYPSIIHSMLTTNFHIEDFVYLESLTDEDCEHCQQLNMFFKVLDFETLLVSSYPQESTAYGPIESNVELLGSLLNFSGKPYQIYRLPVAPNDDGMWNIGADEEIRSYTNSIIINNTVIVPSYGIAEYDNQAMAIYAEALPGYKLIAVDARVLSAHGKSLYHIVKEIPVPHHARILHQKVLGERPYSPEFYIYSNCQASSNIQLMWLYYKINQEDAFTQLPVYIACPQNMGIIENLLPGDTIHYYLELESELAVTTYPLAAPASYFTFWLEDDNSVGISEAQKKNTFTIAPNPSDGRFRIEEKDGLKPQRLRIFDAFGKLLFNDSNPNFPYLYNLNLKGGIYYLLIDTPTGQSTEKLIISR